MQTEVSNETEEEILQLTGDSSETWSKKVAYAAILGALSIALGGTAAFLPRVPGWGIALFDPVSIIWIIALLLGGIEVAIIATIAGFFGLFLFDPTGIGPVFKLLATLPMIFVPWFAVRYSTSENRRARLSSPRVYSSSMFAGYLIRLAIMIALNLIVVPVLYEITDVVFIITYAFILNTLQSFWDALIPYLVVFKSKVADSFALW